MIKAVATIFALYGVYALSTVYVQLHWFGVALAAASLAAGIGLWLCKPWSQYLVHLVSFVVAGQWLWAAISYYSRTGWPSEKTVGHIIALIPGLCIVGLAVGSSILAFRFFRARSQQALRVRAGAPDSQKRGAFARGSSLSLGQRYEREG